MVMRMRHNVTLHVHCIPRSAHILHANDLHLVLKCHKTVTKFFYFSAYTNKNTLTNFPVHTEIHSVTDSLLTQLTPLSSFIGGKDLIFHLTFADLFCDVRLPEHFPFTVEGGTPAYKIMT
jgi:hypothetical protein